ncbi:hypothetical protein HRI_001874800 [Hibiscus trionum]|uniref:D-glycerate 3-kinase, chloroplastic n=1 Tax=Hibiscus trionum TaxID=183268 RepID=A0A9W7M0Z7_HIBTR|nr:hypothetical protein HRI_001874800 [Hibiscus trionum]
MAAFTTLTPCQATTLHCYIKIPLFHKQTQNVYCPNNTTKTIHSSLLNHHHPNPSPAFTFLYFSGCSWLQDNSLHHDINSGSAFRQGPIYSVFPSKPAEVASVQDLFEFICAGPLVDKVGLTQEKVAESIDKWLFYGSKLCRLFQVNELYLTTPQKARFYHYYIPVFIWCEDQISEHASKFKDGKEIPPLVIGFSAPQGCGKTTLSAYSGRGDRADSSTWPEVEGPLKVVLYEGWMLGFKPLPTEVVKTVDPQLEIVNKNLEAYYDAWDKFIKAWIVIKIQDPSCVYQWRLQAEIAMREAGKPGMTDEEVKDFVSRYLPAYKAYLPTLNPILGV